MKKIIVAMVMLVLCAVAVSSFAVADDLHPRAEFGSKIIALEWCTEEFHTQVEFHKEIANLTGMIIDQGKPIPRDYQIISGGNAWTSDETLSPESSVNIFIRTEVLDEESVEDAQVRLLEVVRDSMGIEQLATDPSRIWVANGKISYLIWND